MLVAKIRILQRHAALIYDPIKNVSTNKFSIGISRCNLYPARDLLFVLYR